jgi:enoyl-[acyl-carrier protein] reductase II
MAFVGGPRLVAAVSNAGGLGVLGTGPIPPAAVGGLIQATRGLTARPFGINFIVANGSPTGDQPFTTDEHIEVCVREGMKLVTFFWTVPPERWVRRLHEAGARVWMQVGSVAEAREAVAVGVDGVIVQGREAGGHVRGTAPLHTLLPEVIAAVAPRLVLAAGGIVDGASAAAAFSAGADGVWVGTRLVASEESEAHPEYKQRLTAANASTAVTTVFGPEWPGQPMRVLRNRVVSEWAGREHQVPPPQPGVSIGRAMMGPDPYEMPKFSAILPTRDTTGDFEEMCLAAGEGVSRIHDIRPAATIIEEMMRDTARSLRSARG